MYIAKDTFIFTENQLTFIWPTSFGNTFHTTQKWQIHIQLEIKQN